MACFLIRDRAARVTFWLYNGGLICLLAAILWERNLIGPAASLVALATQLFGLNLAVAEYAAHGMDAVSPLVAAARAYTPYLRRHIEYENEQLLARVEHVGSPGALAAALASFDRFEDDVMGAGVHEQLHRMIDTLGPRLEANLS